MSDPTWSDDSTELAGLEATAIPLFPLPNVVLFPRAVLPLHIFEERYKAMTADALAGNRKIAMALLAPGWEKCYWDRPQIDPVVCVGTILSHEKLPDGKYNFLLQGTTRARITREICAKAAPKPYRLAKLEALPQTQVMEIDLEPQRQRMVRLFSSSDAFGTTSLARQFRKLLNEPTLRTSEVADLVAFSYFEDVALKQSLLAEGDVVQRIERTLRELESMRPLLRSSTARPDMGKPSLN
jgi:Lon protease-like protein